MKLACITTSHNRVTSTCDSLLALKKSCKNIDADFYVLDDASTDGTAEALKSNFSDVILIKGDGNFFWNRGMRISWLAAINSNEIYDAYLLFNDDTFVYEDAIDKMLRQFRLIKKKNKAFLITGSTLDPNNGTTSYGGQKIISKFYNPLSFCLIEPEGSIRECDTINMNFTLISPCAVKKIGVLDSTYHHSFGDLDYGLRLKKAGGLLYVLGGHIGECSRNNPVGTWRDQKLGRLVRLKKLLGVKGMPIKERFHYCKQHGGAFWILHWLKPYLSILILNKKPRSRKQVCRSEH